MGRSEGQAGACDRMRRFVSLVLVSLLVGCAHTNVGLNSSGTAAAGTSSVSGQISASGSGNAAILLFGLAAAAIYGSESSSGGTTYRANPFDAMTSSKPAPELDGSRRVHEQDCSKPIRDWSANLKCR